MTSLEGWGTLQGDLAKLDANYSVFESYTAVPANVLDPQTVASPEYISSITGTHSGQSGNLADTHYDDTNYYTIDAYDGQGYDLIDIYFNLNPPLGDKISISIYICMPQTQSGL